MPGADWPPSSVAAARSRSIPCPNITAASRNKAGRSVRKLPGSKMYPPEGKQPRAAVDPDQVEKRRPSFRISTIDWEWNTPNGHGWSKMTNADLRLLHERLKGIESCSWQELQQSGSSHMIEDPGRLSPAAKKR